MALVALVEEELWSRTQPGHLSSGWGSWCGAGAKLQQIDRAGEGIGGMI